MNKSNFLDPELMDMINNTVRLSDKVGTRFKYDWSNPNMPEDVFIYQVIQRGIFHDMRVTAKYFGFERVDAIFQQCKHTLLGGTLRSFRNIEKGYYAAQESARAEGRELRRGIDESLNDK